MGSGGAAPSEGTTEHLDVEQHTDQHNDLVVGVLVDVASLDRVLDYRLPARWRDAVVVGTVVRVPLQGRRVRGWVVEVGRPASPEMKLRAVTKVTGQGPDAATLHLAAWAARRWAGRRVTFLRAATSPRAEPLRSATALPVAAGPIAAADGTARRHAGAAGDAGRSAGEELVQEALTKGGVTVLRWPPAADLTVFAAGAVARGQALVLTPSIDHAAALAEELRRRGVRVARESTLWADALAGASVVGGRAAVWVPLPALAAVVVLDEHDERFRNQRAPTWHAREVAMERARRAGVACVLVSPTPTLEALSSATLLAPPRRTERDGWPPLLIVDRRREDPRQGLLTPRVVDLLRGGGRVVAVFNRVGRARLVTCTRCGEIARCERCRAALGVTAGAGQPPTGQAPTGQARGSALADVTELDCPRCHLCRPAVCPSCGATRLAVAAPGVSRIRAEIEALVSEPVEEVTGALPRSPPIGAPGPGDSTGSAAVPPRIVVGTEAALHRVAVADVVIFLDIDQDLTAPRYRAAEQSLSRLALAARLVGGRQGRGRLVAQTRIPHHEVLQAVLHADPARLAAVEDGRRAALGFPPHAALARITGLGSEAWAEGLRNGSVPVQVQGPTALGYLVRAVDHDTLSDALELPVPPRGRVRIEVDPPGV